MADIKDVRVVIPSYVDASAYMSGAPASTVKYPKYQFTVAEAMQHLMQRGREFMLPDMILHNVGLRELMREHGAGALMEMMYMFTEPNKRLLMRMDSFITDWRCKQLSDLDIQVMPITETITIDGQAIDGLYALKSMVEASYLGRSRSIDHASVLDSPEANCLHVAEVWEPYPVFDSYDSADDRTYQNYLIRRGPITDQEIREVYSLGHINLCAISDATPTRLLPLVYYRGDGAFMLLATKRGQHA